jgi:uncharacterized damage-inducible protein DinB
MSMNYYGAKELAASARTVRKNTIIIAEDIPENKYDFRPSQESRSIAETLVHIATVSLFQQQIHGVERRTTLEGIDFPKRMQELHAEEKKSRTKAEIIKLLRKNGEAWANWLEGLSDEFLAERVSMPPGAVPANKTRFEMVLGVKEHEMHHRGQLMQTERMVGIVPHLTRDMQARMATAQSARTAS